MKLSNFSKITAIRYFNLLIFIDNDAYYNININEWMKYVRMNIEMLLKVLKYSFCLIKIY